MIFKKLLVVILIFILFSTFFNINTVAINSLNYDNNKTDFDGYIIQFKDEPIYSFINKLKNTTKNLFSNYTEKINNSFFINKIKEYKEKLNLNHRKTKNEIITTLGYKGTSKSLFKNDYYKLFNGISIKKISNNLLSKIQLRGKTSWEKKGVRDLKLRVCPAV